MSYSVSIIGTGNVAWHLAPALENAGNPVNEVYGRNTKSASELVKRLYDCELKNNLDFSDSKSSLFILAVTDSSIEEISKEIVLPEQALLVHTSGNTNLDVLEFSASPNIGVLYPLQTFSKNSSLDMETVPFLVEASNDHSLNVLKQISGNISNEVLHINSEKRRLVHIAAVFASNFSNYMLTSSQTILAENNLSFKILKPLIAEQINKALTIGPEKSQTGPAKRNDFKTLDSQLSLLNEMDKEELSMIYKLISQSIIDHYG